MTRTIPALGAALLATTLLTTALVGAGRTAPGRPSAGACLDAPAPAPVRKVESVLACSDPSVLAQTEAP
jgi:hypothetical protein